jgi:hypothetical protein
MGTDGLVRDPTATYSFVISIARTDVKMNVREVVDSFQHRLLSIWIGIRNVQKQQQRFLLGLHG